MIKRILLAAGTVAALAAGVIGMSAFEAHVINVTAHIENALAVNTNGIAFGTVFPQEYMERSFDIALSSSFLDEDRVDDVHYSLIQKTKPWTLNFGDVADVDTHNRSLIFVDPDPGKGEGYDIGITTPGKLHIKTGTDVEDLFGQNEIAADWTAPRMVIPMGGNFTIETKVTANPMAYPDAGNAYQSGGILVYESNGNVVRLDLTNFSGLGSTAVYMESQMVSAKTGKGWDSLSNATTVWLKLSRNGNTFKGEYSLDGIAWNPVTTQEGNFVNGNIGGQPKVGLAVVDNNANNDNTSFSADFDYVTFNGDYLNLCPFLSKTNDDSDGSATENNDISHPSYYNDPTPLEPNSGDESCQGPVRYTSSVLNYGPTGWGGWSCPAGTHAVAGGVIENTYPMGAQGIAEPGAIIGGSTYPVFPHYTFPAGETGYVAQNGGTGQSAKIYVDCLVNDTNASGILSKIIGDTVDTWNIDLKVPPVIGNVGQDWPASCAQYVVPENEKDYGCDIWVEVTDISTKT